MTKRVIAEAADICAIAASSGWHATRCFGGPAHALAWKAYHLAFRDDADADDPDWDRPNWAEAECMLRTGHLSTI